MRDIIFIENSNPRSGIIGYDNISFRIIVVITQGGDRSIITTENNGF